MPARPSALNQAAVLTGSTRLPLNGNTTSRCLPICFCKTAMASPLSGTGIAFLAFASSGCTHASRRSRSTADRRSPVTLAALSPALLERATQLLAAAEKSNRELHAYGLQLIDEVRGRASSDASAAVDPVLGLRQVRIENRAEELRDGLDALKLPAQARP